MFCGEDVELTEQDIESAQRSAFVIICDNCLEQKRLADIRHAEEEKKGLEAYEKLKAKLIASGEACE